MSENINKTLAEQLAINEHEISYRKEMFDFHDYEIKCLADAKPYITSIIDDIVAEFYIKQIENPEISLLIGDSETLHHLKGAMRLYIIELFSGNYGTDYVNRRLRIGKVHKRIGSPQSFIYQRSGCWNKLLRNISMLQEKMKSMTWISRK